MIIYMVENVISTAQRLSRAAAWKHRRRAIADGSNPTMVLIPFDRLSGPQHYRIDIIKEIEAFMFAMSDRRYRYQ